MLKRAGADADSMKSSSFSATREVRGEFLTTPTNYIG